MDLGYIMNLQDRILINGMQRVRDSIRRMTGSVITDFANYYDTFYEKYFYRDSNFNFIFRLVFTGYMETEGWDKFLVV